MQGYRRLSIVPRHGDEVQKRLAIHCLRIAGKTRYDRVHGHRRCIFAGYVTFARISRLTNDINLSTLVEIRAVPAEWKPAMRLLDYDQSEIKKMCPRRYLLQSLRRRYMICSGSIPWDPPVSRFPIDNSNCITRRLADTNSKSAFLCDYTTAFSIHTPTNVQGRSNSSATAASSIYLRFLPRILCETSKCEKKLPTTYPAEAMDWPQLYGEDGVRRNGVAGESCQRQIW